ncbi:MAG: DUF748 domain-containing protein [Burkholderiales bacterium]|nr:DUF748 domain-containing protein [Burkholderiales bacterium]
MGALTTAEKWWIASGCTVAGLIIIYTFFGFFGVPALIRWGLAKYADPIVDRQITASDIYFNPYTLYLNIKGLNVQKANDNIPLLHVDDINTKISWESVFKLAPILDHLTIDGLQANIVRTGLTQFNFSNIIDNVMAMQATDEEKDKKEKEKPSEPFRFAIKKSEILNSSVILVDKYRDRTDRISNFDFTLPMVSNFIDDIDVPITPVLSFKFNGHPFSSDANSLPFTISQKTGVTFTFNGLSLENLASFNPIKLNALVTGGTLSANLNLNFAKDDQKESQVKELRLKGTVEIKNVVIQDILPRTPYDLVKIDSIDVDLKKLAIFAQEIELGEVKISSPDILVVRNDEGINLTELANHLIRENPFDTEKETKATEGEQKTDKSKPEGNPVEEKQAEANTAEANEWLWSLANLTVEDGIVHFQDKTNGFTQDVAPLNISVDSVSSAAGNESTVAFSTALIDGRIAINGQFSINPVKANLRLQSADLNVADAKPYLDEFLNGTVKGIISNNGTVTFALENSKPVYSYTGGLTVDEFNVQNAKGAEVASLSALNVTDVNVSGKDTAISAKGNIALEDFALSDPRAQPPVQPVKFKEFSVGIDNIALADQKAAIGEVKLVEPDANVTMAGTNINLVELGQYIANSLIKEASAKEPEKAVDKAEAAKAATEKIGSADAKAESEKDKSDKAELATSDSKEASEKEVAEHHEEASKSWSWSLQKATIENGNVHFVDETNNFSQNITPINVSVSSLSSELKETGEVDISTGVIGGTLAVNGIVGINPIMGNLKVQTDQLDISQGMPYIQEFLNGVLAGFVSNEGTVTFAIDEGQAGYNYAGNLKVNEFKLTTPKGAPIASFNNLSLNNIDVAGKNALVAAKGAVKLADFVLSDPRGGENSHLVRLKEVNVAINEVDTQTQVATVGEVRVVGPSANVVMSPEGINLAQLGEYLASSLVKQPTAQEKAAAAKEKKEEAKAEKEAEKAGQKKEAAPKANGPWKWSVARVQVADGNVQFTDSANNFSKAITPITATAGPISQNFGNPIQLNANVGVLGGTVSANGSVTISPLKANITAKTAGLQIAEVTPFLSPFLNARINSGQVANDGTVVFSMNGDTPNVQYEGSLNVNRLSVLDAQGVTVATLGSLAASGINLRYGHDISVAIQNLAIGNPLVNVVQSAQGVLNVTTLVKESSGGSAAPAATTRRGRGRARGRAAQVRTAAETAPASSGGLPAISIGHIALANGIVRYRDNQVRPPFTLNATDLRANVSNLSTTSNRASQVSITGLLNGTPMQASGTVKPFASNLSLNMNSQITALSLPAFSGFSTEFTGYPITQGQLTYKGNIDINNQKLNSTNNITINKLEFGNENPNAKEKLPVKLAVSLLQNRNGEINLNLPITGSLSDPNFSVAGVIVKVLTNLITKVVAAPFTIIGDIGSGITSGITDLLTGGSNSNLSANNLTFAPGSAQLTPEDQQALSVVAKAMNDRPSMNIQVTGYATEDFDRGPLADAMLTRQMRFALGTNSRNLSNSQRNRATGMLFSDAYGPNKPNTRNVDEQYQFLQQNVRVGQQEYQGLADQRAQSARTYLVNQLNINPSRVFIVSNNGNPPPAPGVGVTITIQGG